MKKLVILLWLFFLMVVPSAVHGWSSLRSSNTAGTSHCGWTRTTSSTAPTIPFVVLPVLEGQDDNGTIRCGAAHQRRTRKRTRLSPAPPPPPRNIVDPPTRMAIKEGSASPSPPPPNHPQLMDYVLDNTTTGTVATTTTTIKSRTTRGSLRPPGTIKDTPSPTTVTVAKDVEHQYGMPWKSSIDDVDYFNPYDNNGGLFYMPFWEWQREFMQNNLTNLQWIPTVGNQQQVTMDLTFVENIKKKKRMITLCFESDEYRLIRMTYLDGGQASQVFTSLWYPRTNLPVLGIDLLQFQNQTKHLTVVDMQPIHPHEEDHDLPYVHLLEPIRNQYPRLQHRMSKSFYDENQFFSSQMLLGRGNEEEGGGPDYVWEELFPAYQSYVETHLSLVQQTLQRGQKNQQQVAGDQQVGSVEDEQRHEDHSWTTHTQDHDHDSSSSSLSSESQELLSRHKAYDDYSSVRDPAHGLLKALFGGQYADAFVYEVLFPLSSDASRSPSSSTSKHHH